MVTKLSRKSSDKLMNLLYSGVSTEIATKMPIVSRFLYEDESLARPTLGKVEGIGGSVLDDLRENAWRQRPMEMAVRDMPRVKATATRSNILRFWCRNSFIGFQDFYNVFPINRERKYLLSDELRQGVQFKVVKARNPANLLHTGGWYLVFANYRDACVYWLETLGRQLNGMELRFEFVPMVELELKYMSSPYLDPGVNLGVEITDGVQRTPIQAIFLASARKTALVETLLGLQGTQPENYENLDQDPAFDSLVQFLDLKTRVSLVLVRNLPFGLSKHALPKLLWDYDLAPLPRVSDCFTTIVSDPVNQAHLLLIRFADKENATRFVRNFHGRKWDSVQSQKERKLYEPILCEIVD